MFGARGYGEIRTPALEYEQVLTRGDPAAADPAYKLFDEQGNVLVLRSDMTIPIARVVSTRFATASLPLRFCYVAHAYRSVRPQRGQDREMLQAGIELVGVPAHEGTAETLTVLCEVLDAIGMTGYRVGLGDASLYPALLDAARRAGRRPRAHPARAGDARLRRPGARGGGPAAGRRGDRGAPARAAAARRPRGARGRRRRRRRAARRLRGAARAGRRPRDLRPRPRARRWTTTRAPSSRSTTRRWAPRWAAAGATTSCSAASAARCRPRAGRSTSSGSTSPWSASGAGSSCRCRASTASPWPSRAAR